MTGSNIQSNINQAIGATTSALAPLAYAQSKTRTETKAAEKAKQAEAETLEKLDRQTAEQYNFFGASTGLSFDEFLERRAKETPGEIELAKKNLKDYISSTERLYNIATLEGEQGETRLGVGANELAENLEEAYNIRSFYERATPEAITGAASRLKAQKKQQYQITEAQRINEFINQGGITE